MIDIWLSYGKEGFKKFRNYIDEIVIPDMLKKAHFEIFNKRQVKFNCIKKCLKTFNYNIILLD